MQTVPTMTCDRCGAEKHFISLQGTNGMVAYKWDLCGGCFEDVKAMMLNQLRRFTKDPDVRR